MSYTTFVYLAFFIITALLYYILPEKLQKYFLLCANYVFYMWWRPAFGILIFAGTLISYFCAKLISLNACGHRKLWLVIGEIYTIGVLFVFKYLDFFCTSAAAVFGFQYSHEFTLLLPVGISFFTFSVAGYMFDVYRSKIEAERNIINYAVFVSFFPTIMAGPIGYARDFLPQLSQSKVFDYTRFKRGMLRFVWGAAEKMIVADTLAIVVNTVYADVGNYSAGAVIFSIIAYSLQIFFDFAAYSNMAIGTADALGFTVMENFKAPYLTRTVKEFWKKWHISLTSWLREYIYFPLGGSRKGKIRAYFNVLIVFAVSGLWHGAAVTFVIWGLLNGVYQVIGQITMPARVKLRSAIHISEDNRALVLWQMLISFLLVSIAWVFFRAGTIHQAFEIFSHAAAAFSCGLGLGDLARLGVGKRQAIVLAVSMVPYVVSDIRLRAGKSRVQLEKTDFLYWFIILVFLVFIFSFGIYGEGFNPQDFVYFKF